MDNEKFIRDLHTLTRVCSQLQLEFQPDGFEQGQPKLKCCIHAMNPDHTFYVTYFFPVLLTIHNENNPLKRYHSVDGTEWISMLRALEQPTNPTRDNQRIPISSSQRRDSSLVFFHVDQFDDRWFLSASHHATFHHTVRIELKPATISKILDAHSIDTTANGTTSIFATNAQLYEWIKPCTGDDVKYVMFSVPSPSQWVQSIINHDNCERTVITHNHIVTEGTCHEKISLCVDSLIPFLLDFEHESCRLTWAAGYPLELRINTMTVYLAPFVPDNSPIDIEQQQSEGDEHFSEWIKGR